MATISIIQRTHFLNITLISKYLDQLEVTSVVVDRCLVLIYHSKKIIIKYDACPLFIKSQQQIFYLLTHYA